MKKQIFKEHLDNIKAEFSTGRRRKSGIPVNESSYINQPNAINKQVRLNKERSLYNSLSDLSEIGAIRTGYDQKPGSHPDFVDIKNSGDIRHHYITSMFIDIKNSTGLFRKYEPETVANITTAIQKVAMHVCWHYGGYIQRFHGDGLLVYFGGKKITPQKSVDTAVKAASLFSYFIKNELENILNEEGIEKLYTRIGIDLGNAEDVVWHQAGVDECSEITTCSLHTSLAAKMQNYAPSNGIVLGDNVKKELKIDDNLFSILYDQKEDKELRYIFQIPEENFNYTQWMFNWEKYLKSLDKLDYEDGKTLYLKTQAPPTILNNSFLKQNAEGYKPYKKG